MKLIVGLGNPDEKYKNTRHNVGFIIIDKLAKSLEMGFSSSKFGAEILQKSDLTLIKPQTYMNNSGDAVSKVVSFYKIEPQNLIVIHDDVDLKFGVIKKQFGASSAGHRGVESIITQLGTKDFWRVRVGIDRPENQDVIEIEAWVLSNMTAEEIKTIDALSDKVGELVF